jgi:hypothetical protein
LQVGDGEGSFEGCGGDDVGELGGKQFGLIWPVSGTGIEFVLQSVENRVLNADLFCGGGDVR